MIAFKHGDRVRVVASAWNGPVSLDLGAVHVVDDVFCGFASAAFLHLVGHPAHVVWKAYRFELVPEPGGAYPQPRRGDLNYLLREAYEAGLADGRDMAHGTLSEPDFERWRRGLLP